VSVRGEHNRAYNRSPVKRGRCESWGCCCHGLLSLGWLRRSTSPGPFYYVETRFSRARLTPFQHNSTSGLTGRQLKPFAIRSNCAHTLCHHRQRPCAMRRWLRDRLRSRLTSGETILMLVPFQPPPPPCVKCGTTTAIAPAFEGGQRVFVVRCPECRHAQTYSLNYDTLREW
jgi:hypothetical protein